ncbi:hypothetical protein [Collinsella aerofaciens]
MTVKELIEELEQVPEDTPVYYDSPTTTLYDVIDILWKMEDERIVGVVLA